MLASWVLTSGAVPLTSTVTVPPVDLHIDVQRGRTGHLQLHAALFHGGKTTGVHGQVVLGGRQLEELINCLDGRFWWFG